MDMDMDMVKVFHMNGGIGEASYSSNSGLQRMGIMKTKGVIEQAISRLCHSNDKFPETLVMADLGCSLGPNTLLVGSMLIDAVSKTSFEMGLNSPDVQINLNDLPTNDFNTIFIGLQEFQENLTATKIKDIDHRPPSCYFTGVPVFIGYHRWVLIKYKTISNTSVFVNVYGSKRRDLDVLDWRSRPLSLPKLEEINKGSVYLSSTTPESVSRAYYEQFKKDFMRFLKCRSEEIMAGGRMVLTFAGRTTDDPRDEESYYLWRPFAMALQEMVTKGLVDEAKLDSFNLPQFTPSSTEIMNLVDIEGSFAIDHLEIFDVSWEAWKTKNYDNTASQLKEMDDHNNVGHGVAKAIRAGIEPLVANHFGEAILDDVFTRYEKILIDRKSCKEKEAIVSITVSLVRKM